MAEDGSFNGHCFACDTPVPNPYGDKPVGWKPDVKIKTQEEIQAEVRGFAELITVDLP